jgi:hypothetical protein
VRFTKISSSPPHHFVGERYNPYCGDRSDPNCREKVEEYSNGWVEGSLNLLFWNGKIVTVDNETVEVEYGGYFYGTKHIVEREVESELERVLSGLPPMYLTVATSGAR